jgi:hypothetical protein
VTLNAAAFALLKGSHLRDYEPLAAIIVTERLAAPACERHRGDRQGIPLGRLGQVDDVSAATLFLLSEVRLVDHRSNARSGRRSRDGLTRDLAFQPVGRDRLNPEYP